MNTGRQLYTDCDAFILISFRGKKGTKLGGRGSVQSSIAARVHVVRAQFSGSSAKANSAPGDGSLPGRQLALRQELLTITASPEADYQALLQGP